ncbi:hypothetical protein HYY75_06525 [bacterium]|nr:hypothetical protein [bacterium]
MPYGGIAAVPDFFRIVLAEVISVLGLVGLSWQLGKWDAKGSRSNLLKENGIPFRFLLLTVFCSLFPTFMAIAKNSGRYSGVEIDEFFIVGLLVILNIFATGIIFWRFSIRWKCGFPRMSHWFCGFSYAFFRGSVSIDILGRIFLVLFGKAISEHVSRTGNLFFGIYLDFLCQGLGVLLGTVHFPPFEPVGGWFQASRFENWWWLFPIVATFIIGRRSAIRHQMSA